MSCAFLWQLLSATQSMDGNQSICRTLVDMRSVSASPTSEWGHLVINPH